MLKASNTFPNRQYSNVVNINLPVQSALGTAANSQPKKEFSHTPLYIFATAMLNDGADIMSVKELGTSIATLRQLHYYTAFERKSQKQMYHAQNFILPRREKIMRQKIGTNLQVIPEKLHEHVAKELPVEFTPIFEADVLTVYSRDSQQQKKEELH